MLKDITTRYRNFTSALALSFALALLMILMALGIMYIAKNLGSVLPLYPYILLLFAVSFIICSVFLTAKKVERKKSIIGGGMMALAVTFALVMLCSAVWYLVTSSCEPCKFLGPEGFIIALAVCMVISWIMLTYFPIKQLRK